MSHAMGLLKFPGREEYLYGEYNGTADVMCPQFYEDSEKVVDHWRDCEWPACPHDPATWVNAEVFTNYGCGYWWPVHACPICNLITVEDDLSPHDQNTLEPHETDGCPEWCKDWCDPSWDW